MMNKKIKNYLKNISFLIHTIHIFYIKLNNKNINKYYKLMNY